MGSFPPRLHVLFARESTDALVIRRGPSRSVALVHWDRRHDVFTLGQWVRHRIYERRCDLSPRGEHLLYFAMNGRWQSETRGAWTAVSKAPYAKALVLLAKGDCWHGGGLWTSNRTYWLNDGYGHIPVRESTIVRRDRDFHPASNFGGECPHVYYHRLLRDGWVIVENERHRTVFDKGLPGGSILRKIANADMNHPPGAGCYWDEHEFLGANGNTVAHADWEWAELDRQRLVWASAGRLFAASLGRGKPGEPQELYDFRGMKFEPIEAPY